MDLALDRAGSLCRFCSCRRKKLTHGPRQGFTVTLNGQTLLQHALALFAKSVAMCPSSAHARIYGDQGAPVIEDIIPGCGPLGGIHAALTHTSAACNLIIAVDTPFLSAKFLKFLVSQSN